MHTIQVFGGDKEARDLASLLRDALPDGVRISPPQRPDSVNMDPATLAIIISLSKDVLVAAITAIGAIWAAKVAAGAGKRDNQPTATEVPKKAPAVEIDTLTDSYIVVVDERFEQRLREVLPGNVRSVLNIRLRSTDETHAPKYG